MMSQKQELKYKFKNLMRFLDTDIMLWNKEYGSKYPEQMPPWYYGEGGLTRRLRGTPASNEWVLTNWGQAIRFGELYDLAEQFAVNTSETEYEMRSRLETVLQHLKMYATNNPVNEKNVDNFGKSVDNFIIKYRRGIEVGEPSVEAVYSWLLDRSVSSVIKGKAQFMKAVKYRPEVYGTTDRHLGTILPEGDVDGFGSWGPSVKKLEEK